MTTKKPPVGPPALYNEEAEQAVLGSMIIDPAAHTLVRTIISAGDYYVQKHGWVHEAIGAANMDGGAADFVSLSDALERAGHLEQVGGAAFLTHLVNTVPSSLYAEQYAQIVRDYAVRRAYVNAASQIAKSAYDLDREVLDVRNGAESAVLACRRDNDGGVHPISDVTDVVLNAIGQPSTAVPTGVGALDKALGGLEPAVYIVAARPSMGKTAFLLEMLANICAAGQRCMLFSIEMSATQIVERLAARNARVNLQAIVQNEAPRAEMSDYAKALWEVATWPLTIVDKATLTAGDILSDVQRERMQHGQVDAVFVDGLWLMTATMKTPNRVQEVGSISRDMKRVQRDLNVPIIMAHQLSRACELRGDRRPILSDLRECVTGDTLVLLADGRRVPISELCGQDQAVLSVSGRGKIAAVQGASVWRVGQRHTLRLTLATGRQITTTKEHRLYGADGWKQVRDFVIGDRIAIARTVPEPAAIRDYPDHEVALLAHLIGDGSYIIGSPLRYTTADEECSKVVTDGAEALGSTVKRAAGRGRWHQLVISGNGNRWHHQGVNRWLRDLGIFGQRSHDKCVPGAVFGMSNAQIALFLRHLWATDGSISVSNGNRAVIMYSTCSERLVRDVAALLLRLGIVARVGKRRKDGVFQLVISGHDYQSRFLATVGAFGPRVEPARRAQAILGARQSNTNVDTLPNEVFEHVKARMREQGISQRKMAELRGTSYGGTSHFGFAPSREHVADYARILNDDALNAMATNDLFWDAIVEIEDAGMADVFDLTVPGTHSWLADGIVSHNSGDCEQDADVVLMMYREGYYNPDHPEANVAEVWIRKNRLHGPSGECVKLYWKGAYMGFEPLAVGVKL